MDSYIILKHINSNKLMEEVSEKMEQGYIVSGGVSAAVDGRGIVYLQSLVLPDNKSVPGE